MKSGHEGTREMLPDYLRGNLTEELRIKVETHLKGCRDCMDELSFLTELVRIEVPDPGDIFWKTLPQRVKGEIGEENARRFSLRSFLLKPFPIAATIVAAFFLIFTYIKKKEVSESDPTFIAPLTASVLDYGDITEKDIPLITEQPAVYELFAENLTEHSYHREFVSLSSKELEGLYEALEKEQERGG
jgi:hypothetical protein